jgi:hypothetical protein
VSGRRAAAALAGALLAGALQAGCAQPAAEQLAVVPLALPVERVGPLLPVPAGRLDQARPTALVVPAIDVALPALAELHGDAGGVLRMPADVAGAGWSTLGPTPGARGPAVIVGDAAGPFGRLAELVPGDEVTVVREDGTRVVFTVHRVERFARAAFPGDEVWGDTTAAELRLVTAGGVFDRGGAPESGNVVAFARLAGVRG